jgi:hypothetical protein
VQPGSRMGGRVVPQHSPSLPHRPYVAVLRRGSRGGGGGKRAGGGSGPTAASHRRQSPKQAASIYLGVLLVARSMKSLSSQILRIR